MSDQRRFFKHTLIFGIGGLIGQLVPFILLPLYTNYLTPAEYGILDVLFLATDIISAVFLIGGIRLAAMTFYRQAESEEMRRRIAVTISSLLLIAVTAAIFLSVCFIDYIDLFFKTGEKKILAFGLAVALLESFTAVPMTLTQARLESLRFVLTSIVMAFARLGLCIYFVAWLHWGIWGFLYAQAIVSVVFGLYLTSRELWIGSLSPDFTKWKEIFVFALPLVPNGILAFIYWSSGRIFILHMGPYEHEAALGAVGLYALASKIVAITPVLGTGPLTQVWTVEMYDVYKKPDAARVFGNFMLRLLCVKAFAVLLISVFAREFVRVVSDSSFHDAAAFVPFLGFCSFLSLLIGQMKNTFFITRKTNYTLITTLLSLPFMLLFMSLFVPRWGLIGAVIAWGLSQCFSAGITYFFTQRLFAVCYPFRKMAALLLVTAGCYGLSLLCGCGIELSSLTAEQFQELSRGEKLMNAWNRIQWLSMTAKMGILLLWGVLVWFSGILSPEDKDLVIRVFKRGLHKIRLRKTRL